ncbi:branched-chain amino acid ABC transporter permease [Natrinema halophilum]|uniref:Branched-chain amino acid ABC transporter permease n=1 Tax=Natrinema halophilum TaxID=1699371 RepID=A0A7D5KQM5_9EURY|nr:branched-chain amino acid ABC transporter permease [Natrinema halophilum]QLG48497.1 branched-chain amino acid ABC transporter permease [Natrinema halophilum]
MTLSHSINSIRQKIVEDAKTPKGYVALSVLAIALLAPAIFGGYLFEIVLQMVVFVLVVASWNLIAGYFGVFSFAHAALFGVGGYIAAILAGTYGIHPVATIVIGGGGAAIASLIIAPMILRLGGSYVAMATLAYAEILYLLVYVLDDITGGAMGYIEHPALFDGNMIPLYYFALAIVLLNLAVLYVLLRSRFGLIGRAIREEEDAAKMLGNNTDRYKVYAFVLSSAMAGTAGGIHAFNIRIFSPSMMAIEMMIEFMAMAVIGGIGTSLGPVVGVIAVLGFSEFFRSFGEIRLLLWGLLLMFTIMFFPGGLAGSSVQQDLLRDQAGKLRSAFGSQSAQDEHSSKEQ